MQSAAEIDSVQVSFGASAALIDGFWRQDDSVVVIIRMMELPLAYSRASCPVLLIICVFLKLIVKLEQSSLPLICSPILLWLISIGTFGSSLNAVLLLVITCSFCCPIFHLVKVVVVTPLCPFFASSQVSSGHFVHFCTSLCTARTSYSLFFCTSFSELLLLLPIFSSPLSLSNLTLFA